MGVKQDLRNELALLPCMLGKFLGAILAGIGVALSVSFVLMNLLSEPVEEKSSGWQIVIYVVMAAIGIIVFQIFDSKLKKKMEDNVEARSDFGKLTKRDLISWAILALAAIAVILIVLWIERG